MHPEGKCAQVWAFTLWMLNPSRGFRQSLGEFSFEPPNRMAPIFNDPKEVNMLKHFKYVLYVALAIVAIAAIALPTIGSVRAAAGEAPSNASADSPASAPAADTTGPGEITYEEATAGIIWSPGNAYLASDGSVTLHGTLPDATVTTVTFNIADATKIDVTKAISAATGDPLTVAVSGNAVTLTSKNGAPLGTVVIVTFAVKSGQAGLVFPYSNTDVATLSGPAFSIFNNVTDAGAVQKGTVCYNYAVSDPESASATLTLLPDTTATAEVYDLALTTTVASNVLTVTHPYGIGLGQYVNICFSASADDKPFGVPESDSAVVITIP